MSDKKERKNFDYGLIEPLTIPPESKVPDSVHGNSTEEEYDQYFYLLRNSPDLVDWSKSCLNLYQNHVKDLERSNLDVEDKYKIIKGWLNVFQVTQEKWVQICEKEQQRR